MTGKTRLNSRPATRADIVGFYGQLPGDTIRARVLERDGRIVGVAGYYRLGNLAVVFSDISGDIPKMTIWREAVAMMRGLTTNAICKPTPGAEAFLLRLGWKDSGEVFTWQP